VVLLKHEQKIITTFSIEQVKSILAFKPTGVNQTRTWTATCVMLDAGLHMQNVWADIYPINAQAKERLGYGIELDAYRAEQAASVVDQLIYGDCLDVYCPVESFGLAFLNPPYDWTIGEGRSERLERVFLAHAYRWLKVGGVLVLVVPAQHVCDCGEILASRFKETRIFRLTDPEADVHGLDRRIDAFNDSIRRGLPENRVRPLLVFVAQQQVRVHVDETRQQGHIAKVYCLRLFRKLRVDADNACATNHEKAAANDISTPGLQNAGRAQHVRFVRVKRVPVGPVHRRRLEIVDASGAPGQRLSLRNIGVRLGIEIGRGADDSSGVAHRREEMTPEHRRSPHETP
jgi:hypothetical protein